MQVLITGATGFIGRHLIRALAPRYKLICLVRQRGHLPTVSGLTVVEGDLADPGMLCQLPRHVDAIVHLAQANVPFPGEGKRLFAVNATSTLWLADYARCAGVSHFVYASSGSVYAPGGTALCEGATRQPENLYALTKYVSERVLDHYGDYFNVSILRLFVPYGPGQTGRMIPGIIASVRDGRPVTLVNGGEPLTNPIYVTDVVEVFVRSMTLEGHHTLNVAGPDVVSVRDIAELSGAELGRKPVFEYHTTPSHRNLVADTTKLQTAFDLGERVRFADGLSRTIKALER